MINENIEDIIFKMPICFGYTDYESRWKWNVSNILAFNHTTNCGSQLVGMLEWYPIESNKEWFYPLVNNYQYSLDFIDWLHEKNNRIYHGLHNSLDWESDIVFQLDTELFKYKLAKEQERFKIYG